MERGAVPLVDGAALGEIDFGTDRISSARCSPIGARRYSSNPPTSDPASPRGPASSLPSDSTEEDQGKGEGAALTPISRGSSRIASARRRASAQVRLLAQELVFTLQEGLGK